jgi:hypothetical protein
MRFLNKSLEKQGFPTLLQCEANIGKSASNPSSPVQFCGFFWDFQFHWHHRWHQPLPRTPLAVFGPRSPMKTFSDATGGNGSKQSPAVWTVSISIVGGVMEIVWGLVGR